MITRILKSTKWRLLLYFALSSVLTIAALFVGWLKWYDELFQSHAWIYYLLGIVILNVFIGYVVSRAIQRRIDTLHLSMLQVSKGNLSERIPPSDDPTFSWLYYEFNAMVDSMEKKMKLLQKLGEQEALELEKTAETAVLEERKRLARDLHDTVSQHLFAIHMSASSLPKVLDLDMDRAKAVLAQLINMSYLAQKQMRGLIAQLRPLELEDKTLAEALDRWFPDYCRQNGLQGKKDIDLQGEMSEGKEHQLFLIIQEAMANIVKHASAKHVSLSLTERGSQYSLIISDDGQGFQQMENKTGSYGLSTMRERAEKLGGDAEIISKPGAGTTIRVHIPKFEEERDGHGTDESHDR
ncbi:sensor histidine kinase [Paenibacillus sp. MSJ-34]|uniref:sensor histidine kinase n=1 Tax=Paenibacillus sp. MSJ-34 TaxID=2841529 RepID=UPI001C109348|nr:sensor histidine kinase [Paenibacillus sp. MSJ-34]MBU5442773.1 sensor histidine kinase [Paenibacillus sp. MSJ-34]